MTENTSKTNKANTTPHRDDMYPAFTEPTGWAMNWEGHALGQYAAQANHPPAVANDVRPTDKPNRT